MDRWGVWAIVIGAVVAVVLVFAAGAEDVAVVREAPRAPWDEVTVDPPATTASSPPPTAPPEDRPESELFDALSAVAAIAAAACVLVLLAIVVAQLPRLRRLVRELRWLRQLDPQGPRSDEIPEGLSAHEGVVAEVAADAGEQRATLARGAPRNAIVEFWMRLEAAVDRTGVAYQPSDTSTELTERILAGRSVDPRSIRQLAALYREARFSNHPMDEPARDAAIAALDAVHDGLGVGAPA